MTPSSSGLAVAGVGEATGVGEKAMGVEVEVVSVDEGATTMAAAVCPAGRAGPGAFGRCAGLQVVRGGCELALTSESAAAARACPLGAPGLPREGGGERREMAEAAS